MKLQTLKMTILYIFLALGGLFLILWLVDYSNLGIPEILPVMNLRTYGIMIMLLFIVVFIAFQKHLLSSRPSTSIFSLIALSGILALSSLFLYQLIRYTVVLRFTFLQKFSAILLSSLIPSLAFVLIAASITLHLKNVKGIWRQIPTVLLLVLMVLSKTYIQHLEW